jgi:hypothetical protein
MNRDKDESFLTRSLRHESPESDIIQAVSYLSFLREIREVSGESKENPFAILRGLQYQLSRVEPNKNLRPHQIAALKNFVKRRVIELITLQTGLGIVSLCPVPLRTLRARDQSANFTHITMRMLVTLIDAAKKSGAADTIHTGLQSLRFYRALRQPAICYRPGGTQTWQLITERCGIKRKPIRSMTQSTTGIN